MPVARGGLGGGRGVEDLQIPKHPQISLCRLHTWSRASMGQDILSDLAMLHTCTIDLLEVVDKFSKKHQRRMQLESVLLH